MQSTSGENNVERNPDDILKVFEESYDVGKLKTVTGRVLISTKTESVEELVKTTLRGETVEVTRMPMDQIVTEIPSVRTEGNLTIVPVVEEILVVEKRLRLIEELHIRRHETQEDMSVPVTLRKQHAEIDRLDPEKD